MSELFERPFELLRRQNGERYDDEIIKNWYYARSYVLEKLKNVSFKYGSNDHLHVLVLDGSPQMLSVVRQIALTAHYINFNETPLRNRTVITIISKNPDIRKELQKEEYLCNLPKYCKFVDIESKIDNNDSYIDIEIHIVGDYSNTNELVFSKEELRDYCKTKEKEGIDIMCIDTRKAILLNRIYNLGAVIDNLPAEDIHSAKRYALALDVFQYQRLKEEPEPLFDEDDWMDLSIVKEKLSCIFCADCFNSRCIGIQRSSKDVEKIDNVLWEQYNEALSKSEHSRWVVEKLIMGYNPLNAQQRFIDESLFYDKKKRKEYRNSLKKEPHNPAHIDLCSYADLRRIDPASLKYDSFLMLAIPKILERIKELNQS